MNKIAKITGGLPVIDEVGDVFGSPPTPEDIGVVFKERGIIKATYIREINPLTGRKDGPWAIRFDPEDGSYSKMLVVSESDRCWREMKKAAEELGTPPPGAMR